MSGHGGGRRKRGGHGGGGGGGHGDARFLVTYADLLTVLMALFLVLWVLASIDLNKFKKFTQGLGEFGNPAAETVPDLSQASPGATAPPETVAEPTKGVTTETTDPASAGGGGAGSGTGTGEVTGAGTGTTPDAGTDAGGGAGAGSGELTSEQLQQVAQQITGDLAAANIPSSSNSVRVEARGLIVTIQTDGVLFESASSSMTAGGRDILAALAPVLRSVPNKILIEGHTDKRPLARANYDNWNLSADRAISVLRTLMNALGVPSARLAATGYAEFHPVDPGDTPAALAKNRRVEIVVVAKADAPAAAPAAPATPGGTGGTGGEAAVSVAPAAKAETTPTLTTAPPTGG